MPVRGASAAVRPQGGGVRPQGGGGMVGPYATPRQAVRTTAPAMRPAGRPAGRPDTRPSSRPWGSRPDGRPVDRSASFADRDGRAVSRTSSTAISSRGARPTGPSGMMASAIAAPAALPAGAKPLAKPQPHPGAQPGKAKSSQKPSNWPWWKPWFPYASFWPDWAPGWWTGWGVVNADLVDVGLEPHVVLWIDRCSPEWAEAFRSGTAAIPTDYDGWPVIVRYTCGNLSEMESVPGTPAYGATDAPSVAPAVLLVAGLAVGVGIVVLIAD